jgi:flavin reductase (DIM6/NTAB) family NADH-FMN oxidoreductase RutF
MSVDSLSFRRALGQFASGVTVVTTRSAGGAPLGLTVSAFCSVSLHPPLVLVCLDRRSDANEGLRDTGLFAVSVLSEAQEEVSRRFASRGRRKLEGFAFLEGRHALPLVPGALAHLSCRVRSQHVEGDHLVWVGEVTALATRPGRPLLYHAGGYRTLTRGRRGGSKPGRDRV